MNTPSEFFSLVGFVMQVKARVRFVFLKSAGPGKTADRTGLKTTDGQDIVRNRLPANNLLTFALTTL
jgi:hypothetical protein